MIPILSRLRRSASLVLLSGLLATAQPAGAQTYSAPTYNVPTPASAPQAAAPPLPGAIAPDGTYLAPPQLLDLVARIALYPDDLIGIILPASTLPLQVVEAARYLDTVRADPSRAPDPEWDDAVVALLNYPDVIDMMNRDLEWTEQLGTAVANQQADVVAAIGQFRARAQAAGNLRSDERQIVEYDQSAIRIRPANPQIIYVPYYDPARVVVYQTEPVFRYYPRPCPVYYFNYTSGYPAGFANFWGVSTMFTLSWGTRRVRMFDYDYYDDPFYAHPRPGFFYRRGWHDHDDHDWHDRDRGRRDEHEHDHDRDWRDRDGARSAGPRPRERDWEPRRSPRGGAQSRRGDDRGTGRGDDGPRGGRRPPAAAPDSAPRFDQPARPTGQAPRPASRRDDTPTPRRDPVDTRDANREPRRFGPSQGFAPTPRVDTQTTPRMVAPPQRPAAGPPAPRATQREPMQSPRGNFSQPARVQQRDTPAARMGPPAPRRDDASSMRRGGGGDDRRGNGGGGRGGRDQRD